MSLVPKLDHSYNTKCDINFERKFIENPKGMTVPHYHEDYEIYFLVSGNRKYFVENRIYTLQPNQIAIFRPEIAHQVTLNLSVPYERYLLYVTPRLFTSVINEIRPNKADLNTSLFNLSQEDFDKALSYFSRLEEELKQNDSYSPKNVKNLVSELLIFIFRHNDTSSITINSIDSRIQAAIDFILDNYTEQISLEDAANVACLAPFYFSKVFKSTTALTFKEFLNKVRIDRACELLETTNYSVSYIAQSVGFNSENYFATAFRTINHISPLPYRKAHKKQSVR